MMFDWRKDTNDPMDPDVGEKFRNYLLSIRQFKIINRDEYLLQECRDKIVLDIGPCEHTEKYMNHPNWFFRREIDVAKKVVGVDINKKLCQVAQQKGYAIRHIDATSRIDLGERFDLIIAGDVIEHVSNSGGLLRFIKRHLAPKGKAIITTPNPFYYGNFLSVVKKTTALPNFEHTCWISPTCMNELALREDLYLKGIVFPIKPSSGRRYAIHYKPLRKFMEILSREYFFILVGSE